MGPPCYRPTDASISCSKRWPTGIAAVMLYTVIYTDMQRLWLLRHLNAEWFCIRDEICRGQFMNRVGSGWEGEAINEKREEYSVPINYGSGKRGNTPVGSLGRPDRNTVVDNLRFPLLVLSLLSSLLRWLVSWYLSLKDAYEWAKLNILLALRGKFT